MGVMDYRPWIPFVVAFVASLAAAYILKKWAWWQIRHTRLKPELRERVIKSLETPAKLLLFGLMISTALVFAPDTLKYHRITVLGFRIYFVLISIFIAERLNQITFSHEGYFSRLGSGTRQLIRIIVRGFVYTIGALVIFEILGISITPILASLGVGSLAVALALQDTFTNFFSGVYVLVDRQINVGDYIRVDNGVTVEGYVIRIGWRTTRIRQLSGHTVILPNSKIASSRVTNFNLPTCESEIDVSLAVSSDLNLETVEKTALDAASEVKKRNEPIVGSKATSIQFSGFADSRISLTINMSARSFADTFRLKHELVKELTARFKAAGAAIH